MKITDDTCHTFTHHVERAVVVECVAHGIVVEVDPQPRGEPSAREIAAAAKAEHEARA